MSLGGNSSSSLAKNFAVEEGERSNGTHASHGPRGLETNPARPVLSLKLICMKLLYLLKINAPIFWLIDEM